MYSRKIVGGKLSFLKSKPVQPLSDNVVNKKVEEVITPQQSLGSLEKEKVVVNNSLETKRLEPIRKTRNEKIMKFINFQI